MRWKCIKGGRQISAVICLPSYKRHELRRWKSPDQKKISSGPLEAMSSRHWRSGSGIVLYLSIYIVPLAVHTDQWRSSGNGPQCNAIVVSLSEKIYTQKGNMLT